MIQSVSNNQLVTYQILEQQQSWSIAEQGDVSFSANDIEHRIVNVRQTDGYPFVGINVNTQQNLCPPYYEFTIDRQDAYYGSPTYKTLNRTSMGSTSGVTISHSGIVNVYVKTPNHHPKVWWIEAGAFQIAVWNGKTGTAFVGDRNCYVYDNIRFRTLTDTRSGTIDMSTFYRTLDRNYSNDYTRLFTTTWYSQIPSLTTTAYLSFIVNDSTTGWASRGYKLCTGESKINPTFATHTRLDLGGSGHQHYYQLHSPVQLSTAKGTTTNIYIELNGI